MSFSDTDDDKFEVDFIVDQRKRGRAVEYLVRWKGFGDEEDSWEPSRSLSGSRDAIKAFLSKDTVEEKKKTEEISARKTGTRSVTKTTTTVTKVHSSNLASQSSPESSPVLSRKVFTRTETVTKSSSDSPSKKTSEAPRETPGRFLEPLPLLIFYACLLFVCGSYVMYPPQ